ncbi:hypothetical protein D8M06_10450 [Oceanobacillus halophilus]|uniref:Uncharacterized protein n=1 Tax=Oceanobacillus halophilus TaxID=930130 RepID=A0A495A146_9BACI|nr:hypothetical protein D8M06_10450 [Oceanobacillus halophilus]
MPERMTAQYSSQCEREQYYSELNIYIVYKMQNKILLKQQSFRKEPIIIQKALKIKLVLPI